MQNIRPVSEKKWDISNHAFYQAYHFAMRYKEFKDILRYKTNTVGSPKFGDTTGSGGIGNQKSMGKEELQDDRRISKASGSSAV